MKRLYFVQVQLQCKYCIFMWLRAKISENGILPSSSGCPLSSLIPHFCTNPAAWQQQLNHWQHCWDSVLQKYQNCSFLVLQRLISKFCTDFVSEWLAQWADVVITIHKLARTLRQDSFSFKIQRTEKYLRRWGIAIKVIVSVFILFLIQYDLT